MHNIPSIKVGIVAVSRDCFPNELSIKIRKALVEAYQKNITKMRVINVRSASLKVKSIWLNL